MTKIKVQTRNTDTYDAFIVPLICGNMLLSAEKMTVFDWLRRASSEKSGLVGESLEKADGG